MRGRTITCVGTVPGVDDLDISPLTNRSKDATTEYFVASHSQSPVHFPPELPISGRVQDIARAIDQHPFVIVCGETGSGKTTQIPKICLAMGRGLRARIGCTQPRRIAATSVASRVADELGVELGHEVGFKIRFSDRTSPDTYVKFVTDGILLAELRSDPWLNGYDTIIVDEAHERSLNIDFLLGCLKRIAPKRPDLRVIISSATLEVDRFAAYFADAPILAISGRTYPVEVVYHPPASDCDLVDAVADAVDEITELGPQRDVLIFLPGEREIHEVFSILIARDYPDTVVLPLYGRMPQSEQHKVFQSLRQRRIVLATNVAETSLTIPGIAYVVDSGLARINRYNPRNGMTQLQVERISQASANQRTGRAGRMRSGVCYRLYSEEDFMSRPAFTMPEVQRVGLAGVILHMKTLGLGRVDAFPFLDPPSKRAISDGYRVLEELGALDAQGEPNELAFQLSHFPIDPRLAKMLLAGQREGCLREMLVVASSLSIQDPRERPVLAKHKADECHRRFHVEGSDFAGILKLWDWQQNLWETVSRTRYRKHCRDHYLSPNRMQEWRDLHNQLRERCSELNMQPNELAANTEAIHRAALAGLLGRMGVWQPEKRSYVGARQTRFVIHPSSALAKKPPAWVFAAEIVETSQPFARVAAILDPAWVESIAGPLCKRTYQDAHWEQRPARVIAKEQVSVLGLPVIRDRRVHYGPIDPKVAREIFLLHALVRQEFKSKGAFVEHNKRIMDEARRLRDKARKSEMIADDDVLLPFFDNRVPSDVYCGKTFEDWRRQAEKINPRFLFLSLSDVMLGEVADLTPENYPDSISLWGVDFPLRYRFAPGDVDDGITVTLPLSVLARADAEVFEWTIPGWHEEKILLLLQSLPKAFRKALAPMAPLARDIASKRKPFEGPMLRTLSHDVSTIKGVTIPLDAWRPEGLPDHLRFLFRIVDETGRVLGEGRDLKPWQDRLSRPAKELWAKTARCSWERSGLTSWSFGTLPETMPMGAAGGTGYAFPALVDEVVSVSLRAQPSKSAAIQATRGGLRRLLLIAMGETVERVMRQIPESLPLLTLAARVADHGLQLREQLVICALDDAFELREPSRYPRDKPAFEACLRTGRPLIPSRIQLVSKVATEMGTAVAKVESMLENLSGKPGAARSTLDDVRDQLAHLLPKAMLLHVPMERWMHFPRYLKGMQIRLERLVHDPRRDMDKAAKVVPIWQSFHQRKAALLAGGLAERDLDAFRWLIEELRMCVFAPEIRNPISVSPQKVAEIWKNMGG
ncbi:MAG: ATP-dependent RNA helicase HrpB [Deltaproteobacteria bacterium ADurb.Bin207]|jgi:ATP-dependent helicase HrpA|nr:MAG: ATP-dependent RNA helicase HrpB [Deltaproteobacteria bacterium ADurb.Bin207]